MLADFSEKGNQSDEPVHVINMNVVDNPEVSIYPSFLLSMHLFIYLNIYQIDEPVHVINMNVVDNPEVSIYIFIYLSFYP